VSQPVQAHRQRRLGVGVEGQLVGADTHGTRQHLPGLVEGSPGSSSRGVQGRRVAPGEVHRGVEGGAGRRVEGAPRGVKEAGRAEIGPRGRHACTVVEPCLTARGVVQ